MYTYRLRHQMPKKHFRVKYLVIKHFSKWSVHNERLLFYLFCFATTLPYYITVLSEPKRLTDCIVLTQVYYCLCAHATIKKIMLYSFVINIITIDGFRSRWRYASLILNALVCNLQTSLHKPNFVVYDYAFGVGALACKVTTNLLLYLSVFLVALSF